MSYKYTNPYDQNTSVYGQTDMNRVQGNAAYMDSQMPKPMKPVNPRPMNISAPADMMPLTRQLPISPAMPSAAPTGTTPLARQLPIAPAVPIATPMVPPGTITSRGPTPTPAVTPLAASMPQAPTGAETPVTVASPYYTAGFLRNFIGKNIRVEFVLGTAGSLTDRIGTLLEVGASYIVIQPLLTDDLLMCDLYSIRFVTIIY